MSPVPESPILFSYWDIGLYGLLQMVYILIVITLGKKLYYKCVGSYCRKHGYHTVREIPSFLPMWGKVVAVLIAAPVCWYGVSQLFHMIVNWWVVKIDAHYLIATLPNTFFGWFVLILTYLFLLDLILLCFFVCAEFYCNHDKKVY